MCKKALVVFTVRPYRETDIDQLIKVYQSAFAEPPWNEYWSYQDVKEDIDFALSQQNPIILITENNDGLVGFTWGYKLPLDKFSFLDGKISENSIYMDEIAVKANKRSKGIGTNLGKKFIETINQQGLSGIVLRTDERNKASMALFKKLGFSDIPDSKSPRGKIYDPEFPDRIYLQKEL